MDDSMQPTQTANPPMGFAEAGSLVEVICAIGAIVLGILGLAQVLPRLFTEIGIMAAGVALIGQASAITTEYMGVETEEEGATGLSGGVSTEAFCGLGGGILGLLALLTVAPAVLPAIAVIAFGVGLLRGMSALSHLNNATLANVGPNSFTRAMTRDFMSTAAGLEILAGLGVIALGILALVGIVPAVLVLVAILSVGAAVLLGSVGLSREIAGMMHR
jgi:hypothetical protein